MFSVGAPRAYAQAGAPAAAIDPGITADAARCLAIDTTLAELARNGAIPPDVRKQRADALTAERTRITNAYPRNAPATRVLLAEYGRLKLATALEARERAAADAKAKREAAATEAQAKREAATAELKAKRAAAEAEAQVKREVATAAEAEKARLAALADDALFADVSAVVDERLLRARDNFYVNFGLAAPTVPAAAAQQAAAAQAIRAKHVPPQVAELRPPFDQRVTALYQQRLPERNHGWFAEVFPNATDLVAQVSGDTEKAAALEVAARRLSESTTGIRPYAVQTRLESYQEARRALKADSIDVLRLAQDKKFEARVFEKSLPAYAATVRQQAAREQQAAEAEVRRRRANQLTSLLTLVVLVVGLWFPVHLMRRQKFRWKRQSQADWEKQMATTPLPPDLWWIEVPGFRYPVGLFSGRVYDKEIWTETSVTTTTTTTAGGGTGYYYTAPSTSTSTHVSTTVYHRYWLLTTEGKQTWQRYSDNEVIATNGQNLSTIWCDNYWVLIAYNHMTGAIAFPKWWTKAMHTPPYWRTVVLTALLCIVITGVGALGLVMTSGLPLDDLGPHIDLVTKVMTGVLPMFLIFLLIYVSIASAVITARRQSHFQKKTVPRYEAFLRSHNPVIPEATKA